MDNAVAFALGSLCLTSFLGATVLPIPTELALLTFMGTWPGYSSSAVIVATLGNTLGGLSTYLLGRWTSQRASTSSLIHKISPHWQQRLQRIGPPTLILAWVPFIGDGLCFGAGFLHLALWPSMMWMALGRGLRYVVVADVSGPMLSYFTNQ